MSLTLSVKKSEMDGAERVPKMDCPYSTVRSQA